MSEQSDWRSFRKKPIIISAKRFEAPEPPDKVSDGIEYRGIEPGTALAVYVVPTKEGDMRIRPGDWLIRGIEGELYPCADSIFRASYTPTGPLLSGIDWQSK